MHTRADAVKDLNKGTSEKIQPPAEYRRIEEDLRQRIREGHWTEGGMLPSRRVLAHEYAVSPVTVERAITPLIADGTLRADDRRGTFVTRRLEQRVERERVKRPDGVWAKTATIGIIASLYLSDQDHLEQNNFWVRQLVQSLEHAFSEDGSTTHVFNRARGRGLAPAPMAEAVTALLAENVDAIAVISFDLPPQEVEEALKVVDARKIPLVCILPGELHRPIPHVFYDNHRAGYQAAQHLLDKGIRSFSFIAPFTAGWVSERLAGVRQALTHAGLPADSLRVLTGDGRPWVHEEEPQGIGCRATESALEAGWRPEGGVICVSDGVAFGVLQATSEYGLQAGRDFAIIGFDDHPRARAHHLTSLRPPMEAMGREAARLLLQEMHGEQASLQVRLRAHLIPRASTLMPSGAGEAEKREPVLV